jgi:hypothetical protein
VTAAEQVRRYRGSATRSVRSWQGSPCATRSPAGIGRFIEPAIEPLGFDWRIGIGLITSFAAREVMGLDHGDGLQSRLRG